MPLKKAPTLQPNASRAEYPINKPASATTIHPLSRKMYSVSAKPTAPGGHREGTKDNADVGKGGNVGQDRLLEAFNIAGR